MNVFRPNELKKLQGFLILEETGVMDTATQEAMELFGTTVREDQWGWAMVVMPANWETVFNPI